ncbi:hypothetical protein ACFR9U_15840 [Halorientalis brevis]|uniref:Uncharacterized protein n=1 Tax=Halorientalis brevis TaxID=1126241 RepID=A0ABD6CGK6_9EURY|nr:hypothetical protein [Halorientalis brevis]
MDSETNTNRAGGKYVLALLGSLFVATVVTLPFEGDPEPGSLPRLVWVIVFFAVFTLFFLWDSGDVGR